MTSLEKILKYLRTNTTHLDLREFDPLSGKTINLTVYDSATLTIELVVLALENNLRWIALPLMGDESVVDGFYSYFTYDTYDIAYKLGCKYLDKWLLWAAVEELTDPHG